MSSTLGARAVATRQRRTAILDAALECFTARGYAATTIEEIRRRAGASVGSMYHHFPSKEELAATLHLEALAAYQDGFLEALWAHPRAEAGVQAAVRFHLRWVVEQPRLARHLYAHREPEVVEASREAVRARSRMFFGSVLEWLESHVRLGAVRRLHPDLYYALWIGPTQELARLWTVGRANVSAAEAADSLASAAWEALRARPSLDEDTG
jgi:AcrR family transcriptional regulator